MSSVISRTVILRSLVVALVFTAPVAAKAQNGKLPPIINRELFFVGLLQWAGAIGSINLALVWPLMALLYAISYSIALRRYR